MKHYLLTGLLSAAAITMASSTATAQQTVNAVENLKVTTVKNHASNQAKKIAKGVTLTTTSGLKKLHAPIAADKATKIQIPTARKKAAAAQTPEGYALFESFEGWDGQDPNWIPDGWTVDMRGEVEREQSWTPVTPNPWLPGPSDGQYYYGISFGTQAQDEWLISPEVKVEDRMSFSFYLYLNPTFLFKLDNVDWDAYEFTGEKEVAATLQIWVQPEGGEWTMLHDLADDYKDKTLLELAYLEPQSLEKRSQSLADYAGKTVKVALRYVGLDGDTMLIDALSIGYPELGDFTYVEPFETLYWGFTRSWELTGLTAAIAHYPVYSPLTWLNYNYIPDATFSWSYCHPETAEIVTSDNPDELVVEYLPDYSSEASMRNNFFYPPTLHATAPMATPGSYTAPYTYFQAGGKPERTLNDGTEFEPSLLPFSYTTAGVTFTAVDDETIGDMSIPVFGHNANSNTYWLNYSLNGTTPKEGDYSHLEGIANLFMAPAGTPLVVNGVTVYAWGQVQPDAEFTATIYGLAPSMSNDISTFTTIATATIKGSQIIAEYTDGLGYLCLPFDFSEPAIVQANEEHPAYFIMLQGFNSDKVKYFAPLQSSKPDPNGLCLGYTLFHIDLSNHLDRPAYYNMKPMIYKVGDDYVDLYSSFAIGLNAEYPWLTTDCEGIELTADQSEATVALGSYFDGSKLTAEAPEGLTATVEGRYNKCMLTVKRSGDSSAVDGKVTVKGPGVEVSIPVKAAQAGITGVATDSNVTVTGIYDLNGRRVESTDAKGIYLMKHSDGTVTKSVVK